MRRKYYTFHPLNGLGQPVATAPTASDTMLSTPAAPDSFLTIPLSDGGKMNVYTYGFEVWGNDGSYYYRDNTGYWKSIGSSADNFIQCWGDEYSGGWTCNDGSSGGSWYTSPAAKVKQKAEAAKTTTPTPTPTTPAAPQPQPQPGIFDSLGKSLGVSSTTAGFLVVGGAALILFMGFMGGRGKS